MIRTPFCLLAKCFRGLMIAASLKRGKMSSILSNKWMFPRSYDRGLIEATPGAFRAAYETEGFRGLMIAASLKHFRVGDFGSRDTRFRGLMIAASLKLDRAQPVQTWPAFGFRGLMIAASLKRQDGGPADGELAPVSAVL